MSRENVEVVRAYLSPAEGDDLVTLLKDVRLQDVIEHGPDAAAAYSRMFPTIHYLDPAIECDVRATGGLAGVYRGIEGFARYWIEWLGMWSSYAYRVVEYRDLGDWVLTPMQVEGQGRDNLNVGLLVFQMWLVRDGRIAVMRAFHDEVDALQAVGLAE